MPKTDRDVEFCALCGLPDRFGWWVPTSVWRRVIPEEAQGRQVCLPCFDAAAAEAGVDYAIEGLCFRGIRDTLSLTVTRRSRTPDVPQQLWIPAEYAVPIVYLRKTIPPGQELFDTGNSVWTDHAVPGTDPPEPAGLEEDRRREEAFYATDRPGSPRGSRPAGSPAPARP